MRNRKNNLTGCGVYKCYKVSITKALVFSIQHQVLQVLAERSIREMRGRNCDLLDRSAQINMARVAENSEQSGGMERSPDVLMDFTEVSTRVLACEGETKVSFSRRR